MILTGSEIFRKMVVGNIIIDPFDKKRLNPNSYNLRLNNQLTVYKEDCLDMKKRNPFETVKIGQSGYLLLPNRLYLASTMEYTETWNLVPLLEGRSGMARLGISIHACAGFGDIGFCGNWTLEISVVQPVKIYPFIECCQIFYYLPVGKIENYEGKYNNIQGVGTSKMNMEFETEKTGDLFKYKNVITKDHAKEIIKRVKDERRNES